MFPIDLLITSQLVREGSLYICHLLKWIMWFVAGLSYYYSRQQTLQIGQERGIGLMI